MLTVALTSTIFEKNVYKQYTEDKDRNGRPLDTTARQQPMESLSNEKHCSEE